MWTSHFGIQFARLTSNIKFETYLQTMKKLIILSAFFFGLVSTSIAQDNNKLTLTSEAAPKLTIEKTSHDFGTIEEGVQATVTFTFKNTGNAPLVLNSVRASCGCTTPKWTKEPVAPGAEGTITAIYNSKGRPGNFTKTITVSHNDKTLNGQTFLTIRGVVKQAAPKVVPSVANPN